MKSIVFSDINNFYYLYSFKKREMLSITNVLYDICNLYLNYDFSLSQIKKELHSKYIKQDLMEGCNDFEYFNKHGYLDTIERSRIISYIPPASIEQRKSNIKVITFELTQKCNLECTYCVYGDLYSNTENNHKRDLSFEKAKATIDYFAKQINKGNSTRRVITLGFYGGEPLLKFKLIKQIVEYSKSLENKDLSFEYTITTNGILLNKYIDFIVDNDFITLISLDGDKFASSYRITSKGENCFDHIYANIKSLSDKYPQYFKYRVTFNSVLHNRNSCLSTMKFIKDNFNKFPLISTLSNVSINPMNKEQFKETYKSLLNDIDLHKSEIPNDYYVRISPKMLLVDKFFANILGSKIMSLHTLFCTEMSKDYIPSATCSPFSFKIFLSSDGYLYPCEKVGYKYPLGCVNDNNQLIIDDKAISKSYSLLYNSVKNECAKCYNLFSCTTCLFETHAKCNYVSREQFVELISDYVNTCNEKRQLKALI